MTPDISEAVRLGREAAEVEGSDLGANPYESESAQAYAWRWAYMHRSTELSLLQSATDE